MQELVTAAKQTTPLRFLAAVLLAVAVRCAECPLEATGPRAALCRVLASPMSLLSPPVAWLMGLQLLMLLGAIQVGRTRPGMLQVGSLAGNYCFTTKPADHLLELLLLDSAALVHMHCGNKYATSSSSRAILAPESDCHLVFLSKTVQMQKAAQLQPRGSSLIWSILTMLLPSLGARASQGLMWFRLLSSLFDALAVFIVASVLLLGHDPEHFQ